MTQEEFTDLIAQSAVGLAPIMLAHGQISPDRIKELVQTAANLAEEVSKEARVRYKGSGSV